MITERLIWFIDCRQDYRTTTLDKMVHLASTHRMLVEIIIDASTQLEGHGYWHLFDGKKELSKESLSRLQNKQALLNKFFVMNAIKVEISINQSVDYLAALNTTLKKNNNSVVIVEDSAAAKRHSIFQKLTEINAPVLLLSKKMWKSEINLLAAIDPLHEHAHFGDLDENIVLLTANWASLLKAKYAIGHCCYVDSVLAQYKNKVLLAHQDALTRFIKQLRIPLNKGLLLEGQPAYALANYIDEKSVDILVIGMVARNRLEQFWIGSTTTSLLSAPPCDMLLIKR